MNALKALVAAQKAGIRVAAHRGDLVLEADATPPASILDALRRHKAEILTMIREAEAYPSIIPDDHSMPVKPCCTCGRRTFWRARAGSSWRCRDCDRDAGALPDELWPGQQWLALPGVGQPWPQGEQSPAVKSMNQEIQSYDV